MAVLHIASIFVSAFLLFLVQPMIAKALLPGFGGSPAVWGTCLVVFQGLLLAGYACADRVRRLPARTQAAVQVAIVLAPLALLPPALRTGPPPPSAWPVPALVLALAGSVAAPFFALSTNSTITQSWYARTVGREPYFLYAASNLGSLLALAAYPFVLEPRFGLTAQRLAFSAGYAGFVALTLVLAAASLRRRAAPGGEYAIPANDAAVAEAAADGGAPAASRARQRARWAWLAAIPTGLLVSTSLHVSTDIAAVPLLWVLPLAAYLLSFVLAFLPRRGGGIGLFPRARLVFVARLLVAASLASLHASADVPYLLLLALALLTLFAGAWLCHGEVAALRPGAARLGEFYLWVSAGGLAGGAFGNLVAPMLFDAVVEYPLFLVAVATVTIDPRRFLERRLLPAAGVCGLAVLAPAVASALGAAEGTEAIGLLPLVLLPLALAARARPERFVLAAVAVALSVGFDVGGGLRRLESGRSFFGVVRVLEEEDVRMMLHGTTLHGFEFRKTPYPLGYYYPDAPITQTVKAVPDGGRIGVIGLGTGAVAKLARAGQRVDFYEIDPIVEPMARTWFTYLSFSPARVRTVLGDARLTVARVEDGTYDLIVMDAFTSDAIPVHLITEEALALYASKLKAGGRLLVHVSNRYLDVVPVVRGGAARLGLHGVRIEWHPTDEQADWGASASSVVVLAADPAALSPLAEREGWVPLGAKPAVRWTDERSSLLEVVREGAWFF